MAFALLVVAGCGGGGEDGSGESSTAQQKPDTQSPASPGSIGAEESEAGDQSIQNYGSEAAGDDKAEVVIAMRSFLRALGDLDYAKVCDGLSASNRAQLQRFGKLKGEGASSCASMLETLLTRAGAPEARKAAAGTISRVRIGEGNAFVLFRPKGGKLSYFVMQDDDGAWKATSLSAGSPLSP